MKNNIFEVDVKGLRELQSGKPMWFIVRELLQNALDEPITRCDITMSYDSRNKVANIRVEDDSPIGFRDLSDAYTLFKDTYKRTDVRKRGRFNFGEKQALCLSDYARIVTTTGGVEFDITKGTRKNLTRKRERGSEVYALVKMTEGEFDQCLMYCQDIIVPTGMEMSLNSELVKGHNQKPYKTFLTKLPTEVKKDGSMKTVTMETEVYIYRKIGDLPTYIYEMGIPICEIDCHYNINVQQKVPLSSDRDKVDGKYLKLVFGEVLNRTANDLYEEESSATWVRQGFSSGRATLEAKQHVIHEWFGDKALIANPADRRSMDEAISHGYNVIHGAEMSKEEWQMVRADSLLVATSQMFKTNIVAGTYVQPDSNQKRIAEFAKKVAWDLLRFKITVGFYDSPEATVRADFGDDTLRFNVAHFNEEEWQTVGGVVKQDMLDLIIHELGHSCGLHYEHSYHQCITRLGAMLTLKALTNADWFTI